MSHQHPEHSGNDYSGGYGEPVRHDDAYEQPGQYGRAQGTDQYGYGAPQQQSHQGYSGYQGGYGQQPYGSGGYGYGYGQPSPQAQAKATTSLVLGIVGILTGLGIILGPIGLVQARRAREMGADSTAGRILSWIALGFGIVAVLWILGIVVMMILAMMAAGSATDGPTSNAMAALAPLAASLRA